MNSGFADGSPSTFISVIWSTQEALEEHLVRDSGGVSEICMNNLGSNHRKFLCVLKQSGAFVIACG